MKPNDFFIGVMEFFAILAPGALLTFLLMPWEPILFQDLLPPLQDNTAKWIAFAISSYILGHLLHNAGAFLDMTLYDRLFVARKRKDGEEQLLKKTREIMKKSLNSDSTMTSAFSWAQSYVRVHSSEAAKELERGGADSKFFRSLAFVAVAAIIIFGVKYALFPLIGAFLLLIFSLWRYCDLRWKTAQLTYEYFILLTMEAQAKK